LFDEEFFLTLNIRLHIDDSPKLGHFAPIPLIYTDINNWVTSERH